MNRKPVGSAGQTAAPGNTTAPPGSERKVRIVFYGPLGAGKTTCLGAFRRFVGPTRGKPRAFEPPAERTTRVDFVAQDVPLVDGMSTRLFLSTVSGWAYSHVDRQLLLKDVDGVVFVADSRLGQSAANAASMTELLENLRALGREPETVPVALFFNKRDLPGAMPVDEMQASLHGGPTLHPYFEGSALRRTGVVEVVSALTRRIVSIPESIVWEVTGYDGIPYRALVSGKRLYVQQGAQPSEPPYTLIVDGEASATFQEWPSHWVIPRVRVGIAADNADPVAPAPSPSPSPPPAPPVADPSVASPVESPSPSPPPAPPVTGPVAETPAPWGPIGAVATGPVLPDPVAEPSVAETPALVVDPATTPERRFYMLRGNVRFACGLPAATVLISAVAKPSSPEGAPLLLQAGISNGPFVISFAREVFEPNAVAIPAIHLVFSLQNAAGEFVVTHRHDVKTADVLSGELGPIVLPVRRNERPKPSPGLEILPANRPSRRLRLDDELITFTGMAAELLVHAVTGWHDLLEGVRFEIVDDFVAFYRKRVEHLLGRSTFDERESEILEHAGRSCQALAVWDPIHSVVLLNRAELEQQSFGFFQVVVGHELVHVGQSKAHPELDVEWRALATQVWALVLREHPIPKDLLETCFGFMANLEGYARYVEIQLALAYTCGLQLASDGAEVPALAPRQSDTELDVLRRPTAPPSLRTALISNKSNQYDSGFRAYTKLATHAAMARFDPALRPPLIFPKEVLQPLISAALKGDTKSQLSLGDIYRTGDLVGVDADRDKALRWYRLASAGGSLEAAERIKSMA